MAQMRLDALWGRIMRRKSHRATRNLGVVIALCVVVVVVVTLMRTYLGSTAASSVSKLPDIIDDIDDVSQRDALVDKPNGNGGDGDADVDEVEGNGNKVDDDNDDLVVNNLEDIFLDEDNGKHETKRRYERYSPSNILKQFCSDFTSFIDLKPPSRGTRTTSISTSTSKNIYNLYSPNSVANPKTLDFSNTPIDPRRASYLYKVR